MTVDLTFPGDPRFAETARDAVLTALRSMGVNEGAVLAAGVAVDGFLAEHLRAAGPVPLAAQVTAERLTLSAAGRTLTVSV